MGSAFTVQGYLSFANLDHIIVICHWAFVYHVDGLCLNLIKTTGKIIQDKIIKERLIIFSNYFAINYFANFLSIKQLECKEPVTNDQ